jgi:hypothetical protein
VRLNIVYDRLYTLLHYSLLVSCILHLHVREQVIACKSVLLCQLLCKTASLPQLKIRVKISDKFVLLNLNQMFSPILLHDQTCFKPPSALNRIQLYL